MKKIEFLKTPGYIYDLIFLFVLYFNEKEISKHYISPQDEEYYKDIVSHISAIPEELLLFFHLYGGGASFFTEKYFKHYGEQFVSQEYSLSTVIMRLTDYEQVVKDVIQFYFRDVNKERLASCCDSLPSMSQLIMESQHRSDIKNSLFAFFIDPVSIIHKLIRELEEKEKELSSIYEGKTDELCTIQENFNYQWFAEKVSGIKQNHICLETYSHVYISFSSLCKFTIQFKFLGEEIFILLGKDYVNTLHYLLTHNDYPELDIFGGAVSEKNRVEILNLMRRMGEVTIKDVEKELGFTAANAYYHLSLMIKAGLLRTRNQGRTVLYRIDPEYFVNLGNVINMYTKQIHGI